MSLAIAVKPGTCPYTPLITHTIGGTAQSYHLILGEGIEGVKEQCPYCMGMFMLPCHRFLEERRKDR
jgi:hypothetical protein